LDAPSCRECKKAYGKSYLLGDGVKDTGFFEEMIVAFEKDPEFEVEYSVIQLQESICKIHKNQGLKVEILLWIIGWCSDMALKINPKK
jgi:hypothetical protein